MLEKKEIIKIMDEKSINRSIIRMSFEIIERNKGIDNIIFCGIKTRGVPIAMRVASKLLEIENKKINIINLDISGYRDDREKLESEKKVIDKFKEDVFKDKKVIIFDDVLFTGRTTRAALDAIIDKGRPKNIQLAVLIDRGHRELPIRADYVGKNLPTSRKEKVHVNLKEIDGEDSVYIKKE